MKGTRKGHVFKINVGLRFDSGFFFLIVLKIMVLLIIDCVTVSL